MATAEEVGKVETGVEIVVECDSLETAIETLRKHELETDTRFAVFTSSKDFGRTSIHNAKQIHWQDPPSVKVGRCDFDGVPFVCLGRKTYDCQFGKDRKVRAKERRREQKAGKVFATRVPQVDSKKLSCKARCVMREICTFPTHKLTENPTWNQHELSMELMSRLLAGEDLPYERKIIICFPALSDHGVHPIGPAKVSSEPIDPKVAKKIAELVSMGVTDSANIRSHLEVYVNEICQPPPDPANRRFFPVAKTIRNHVYSAKHQRKKTDKARLAERIRNIKMEATQTKAGIGRIQTSKAVAGLLKDSTSFRTVCSNGETIIQIIPSETSTPGHTSDIFSQSMVSEDHAYFDLLSTAADLANAAASVPVSVSAEEEVPEEASYSEADEPEMVNHQPVQRQTVYRPLDVKPISGRKRPLKDLQREVCEKQLLLLNVQMETYKKVREAADVLIKKFK